MNAIDNLLAHHVVTPSQYYDSRRRSTTDEPLQRLMLAVMADALECLSHCRVGTGGATVGKAATDAALWIEEENDEYPFSFNSICDALGINARALRKALDLWLASGSRLARRTPVTQQTIKPQTPNGRRGRAGKRHTKNYLYRELADDALRRSDPLVAG
jgi:hypothetical protein